MHQDFTYFFAISRRTKKKNCVFSRNFKEAPLLKATRRQTNYVFQEGHSSARKFDYFYATSRGQTFDPRRPFQKLGTLCHFKKARKKRNNFLRKGGKKEENYIFLRNFKVTFLHDNLAICTPLQEGKKKFLHDFKKAFLARKLGKLQEGKKKDYEFFSNFNRAVFGLEKLGNFYSNSKRRKGKK